MTCNVVAKNRSKARIKNHDDCENRKTSDEKEAAYLIEQMRYLIRHPRHVGGRLDIAHYDESVLVCVGEKKAELYNKGQHCC